MRNSPSSPSLEAPERSEKPYRIGTLRYDRAGLIRLFLCFVVGGFAYSMIYQIDPRVLPILLRQEGASMVQISIIIGSLTAVLNSVVESVGAYRSDRTRTKWGRRIPYIFWTTPIVTLFILSIPFSPALAAWAQHVPLLAGVFRHIPWAPMIVAFAILITCYKVVYNLTAAIYICLIADVVPSSHLGRFNTLFRVVGACSTFIGNYFLIGLTAKHGREVLFWMAGINLVGFLTICLCVKEGDYPPVEKAHADDEAPMLKGVGDFLKVGFSHSIYRWTYVTRVLIFAANATTPFILFFVQDELGIPYGRAGKLLGYSSLAWILIAYPVGRLSDRFGSVRSLQVTLSLGALGYFLSFFLIRGELSFLIVSFVNTTLFWATWSNETMLAQQIFDRRRMGQLGAANSIVKSLIIAFGTSPFVGAYLDRISGYSSTLHLPMGGDLPLGGLRFLFLILSFIYMIALLCILQVRKHWERLGGPHHYHPPSDGPLKAL